MKPGRGKAKGSGFERRIARALSLWLTDGADATQLIRSVLSGGWTRGIRQNGAAGAEWRQVGDLAANGPNGERFRSLFAVECKHHRVINLYGLWTTPGGESLRGWWSKICKDAKAAGVRPMLIFRQNGMPVMVAVTRREALLFSPLFLDQTMSFSWIDLVIFPFAELVSVINNAELFLQTVKKSPI